MAGTRPTADNADDGAQSVTSLADAIKADTDEDKRACRQPSCHGSLTVEDGRVVCSLCRCTPDGVYLPLDGDGSEGTVGNAGSAQRASDNGYETADEITRSAWRDNVLSGADPKGPQVEITATDGWQDGGDTYPRSQVMRLAGGYERVYDADDDRRPDGVTDEYTFDLSTL